MVQCAPAASVEAPVGQLFVCAKSPAAVVMEEIVSGVVPGLLTVTGCGALGTPMTFTPKLTLEGATPICAGATSSCAVAVTQQLPELSIFSTMISTAPGAAISEARMGICTWPELLKVT